MNNWKPTAMELHHEDFTYTAHLSNGGWAVKRRYKNSPNIPTMTQMLTWDGWVSSITAYDRSEVRYLTQSELERIDEFTGSI